MRAVTALGVVAVHVLFFTLPLNHGTWGWQIQNTLVNSLHFTRGVFMFITAFVLTYGYYGKPWSLTRFWKLRGVGVLLPYVLWSVLYAGEALRHEPPGLMATGILRDILTGDAAYQLYYILLTLQFYLVLPWFLWCLKRLEKHPWIALSISLTAQVVLLYFDQRYLQTSSASASALVSAIANYQDRFFVVYQFYFLLGGMAAIYFRQVQDAAARYSRWIVAAMVAMLAVYWLYNFVALDVWHQSVDYVSSVLQPIVTFYTLAVIAFLFWVAHRWATNVDQAGLPKRVRTWRALADASFGIYLVHPLLLTIALRWLVPHMPTILPVALRVLITWLFVAGGAATISILLMNTPVLSRLVGRSRPLPPHLLERLMGRWDPERTLVLPRIPPETPRTPPANSWDPEQTLVLPRITLGQQSTPPPDRSYAPNGNSFAHRGQQLPALEDRDTERLKRV